MSEQMYKKLDKSERCLANLKQTAKQRWPTLYAIFMYIITVIIIAPIIFVVVPHCLESCGEKQVEHKTQERIAKTDTQYKKEVMREIERNIRVAQFYIWNIQQKWAGNIFLNKAIIRRYISFTDSKNTLIGSVYNIDINIQTAINEIYREFDRVEKIIEKINTAGYLMQNSTAQDVDYLVFVINKSIKVLKQLSKNVKDDTFFNNKLYLSDKWNDHLESIGNDFVEEEGRQYATMPQATLRKLY